MKVKIAKKITDSLILSKTINLDITGATLLSIEEAKTLMTQEQRTIGRWWWLRSPGYDRFSAASVRTDGSVYYGGFYVIIGIGCVRPALNLKSSNLKIGSQFEIGRKSFTVISDNLAVCDETIGECAFRKDYEAKSANDYEKSDIKVFVDNWFNVLKELYNES